MTKKVNRVGYKLTPCKENIQPDEIKAILE